MLYPIGSAMLKLNNIRDKDYLTFDEPGQKIRVENNIIFDIHSVNKEFFEQAVFFNTTQLEKDSQHFEYQQFIAYQLDYSINNGTPYPQYNILEYKKPLYNLMSKYILNGLPPFSSGFLEKPGVCDKKLYHIAYNIYILLNNSTILTKEQRENIQKIHDRMMPITFLTELKNDFLSISL